MVPFPILGLVGVCFFCYFLERWPKHHGQGNGSPPTEKCVFWWRWEVHLLGGQFYRVLLSLCMVGRFWRYQWFSLFPIFSLTPIFQLQPACPPSHLTENALIGRFSVEKCGRKPERVSSTHSFSSAWLLLHLNSLDGRAPAMLCSLLNGSSRCQTTPGSVCYLMQHDKNNNQRIETCQ